MRILAIAAGLERGNLGGAEWHFVEVLKRLSPRCEKITVIVGGDDAIREDFKTNTSVEFIRVPYPKFLNLASLFYIGVASLRTLMLGRVHYDLVWAKQEYPQSQVGAIIKVLWKLPLYITSQNPMMHKEELVANNFLADRFRGLVTPLIHWAFGRADVVAAVSNYSAGLAGKFGAKKVVVIPNGVDLSKFQTKNFKLHKPFRIITTSSLIPRNGIDTLIKACALLDFDFELTIAGDGPLMAELKKLASGDERIIFLGRVENQKIPRLLSQSDLFVRPSRFEGFGASFIEAMAAGVPVVGTPVGGITDFIIHGKTGLLVPVDNPEELAKTILELSANTRLCRSLAEEALKIARSKYSWDKIADRVYQEMTNCL